ncbi:hypothetical protein L3X38_043650 [Prunus dulcis]|uniref:Uncharacterized protein n=1 Tax=Prunus dulcis TaxID=3755 RepID=A0AAD4UX88_PRUDU|nr:hypothetical protein L3X38_043650 [Prunus dulcis]
MKVTTISSAQGDDKYAAPSRNQKPVETGVRHLIVSDMSFLVSVVFVSRILLTRRRRPALRGLPGLHNHSLMEHSWAEQLMNVPTMKIFLRKFLQAKRPILVSLACQLGFWIKKIGGVGVWLDLLLCSQCIFDSVRRTMILSLDHRRLSLTVHA